jgi:hypothetical protein
MGVSQSATEVNRRTSRKVGPHGGIADKPQAVMPEMRILVKTWTRESHGLYDFEGTEVEERNFKAKGNLRISRNESDVQIRQTDYNNFYEQEKGMPEEERERIVARVLSFNGNYWIYHKNFVDKTIDQVLERKPEEKIWRVVKDNYVPEMEMPCFRLTKRDLIKVGRVRFKIRDIMSPVYAQIEKMSNEE